MVRKLSLAIALALGVTPFAVHSLGLGDIKTKSGLNQQFQADIELLSVRDEEIGDIRASLASEEVFAKAGVNRPFFLSQLKFKPVLLANGKGIIRVTSREPVREPFLNFLVELNWPKGRLFREFTVLLDPPVSLRRRPSPVQAATTSGISGTARSSTAAADRSTGAGNLGATEYGPTRRNDTLWKIATEVRHPGASMEQMMMALFRANPQAFIRQNINNLRVGEILRVPERETVLAMTASEAHTAFRDQVENWRLDRTAESAQQPAEERAAGDSETAGKGMATPAGAMEQEAVPEAELKIARMHTAEEAGKSIADSTDQKGVSDRLKEDLLEARETRESALEESKELKSRVENLASQLEDLQRLLELKDEQLAKLQIALGEKPEVSVPAKADESMTTDTMAAPVVSDEAGKAPMEMASADGPSPASGTENAEAGKVEVEIPQLNAMDEQMKSSTGAQDEAPPAVAEKAEQAAMSPDTAVVATAEKMETKPASTVQTKPAPAVEAEPVPQPEPGFLEKLMSHPLLKKITSDPTMMAIGGGVVAVLLALIWLLTGRRRRNDQEFQESILTDTVGGKEEAAVVEQAEPSEPESRTTEETSFLSDFSPSEIDVLPEETGEVDPMAEADVYIAYGRYGQAEELIRQGLERSPQNKELRLKLFEILYSTKNAEAFTSLAESAKAEGLPEADPGAWKSVAAMGAKLLPGNALFTAAPAASTPQEPDSREELNELGELDLGDLAASLDLDDEAKTAQVQEVPPVLPEVEQQSQLQESPDMLDFSDAAGGNSADMDNLEADLASLDSALELDLDELEDGGMDLEKLAKDAVNPAELDDVSLDISSLDLEEVTDSAETPDLSVEGVESLDFETEEVERLELPDVEELPEEVPDELSAVTGYTSDEVNTKLDLARAYLDMGDEEGARSILQEVLNEGGEQQKLAAKKILGGFS
ncbi:MAG: FimV family protein [Gammaproteobacteria bacterium]|nr:FimV family protein [Gammaproteobacteria bacterium]